MQLSSLPQSVIWEIFKIKNSILQFWSPGHGREKKKGGEHKQLRSVMHITQTQKAFCLTK